MDVAVYRERIADFEDFEEDDKEWDRIMMERAQAVPLENFPDPATFLPLDILEIPDEEAFRKVWQSATGNYIKSFHSFTAPTCFMQTGKDKNKKKE